MISQAPIRLTKLGLKKLLADALRVTADPGSNGMLGAVYFDLFSDWPGWSPSRVTADLTPPTYGGHARQALVFSAPGVDATGRPEVQAAGLLFSPTDSTASDRIIGGAIYSAAAAGNLYGAGLLDNAVTLGTPDDDLTVVVKVSLPIDVPDWGTVAGVS